MPGNVAVPTLESISPCPIWSSQSSLTTASSTSTTPMANTPIQWSYADLMYLISCLLPEELTADRLVFSPPIETLHTAATPIHLQLFKTSSAAPPPREAYSKDAPIGTGRPQSLILLAQSNKTCASAADARRSLAKNLLSSPHTAVSEALDKYRVLFTLHHLPHAKLSSVYRGLDLMSIIPDKEWGERLNQLRGMVKGRYAVEGVDGTCVVEARLEIFILRMGVRELEGWTCTVEVALGLDESERRMWAGVYWDAAAFLGRAVCEMLG